MGTTYVTVHGTGDQATAAERDAPKWWEGRSDFCRELLAADKGSRVEPFIWSGANDELDRRQAARVLYALLKEKKDDGPVVLIGHSHGGSVIALALRMAAAKKDRLEQVARWVTVGSPFVQMRRRRFPWERFNIFGQAVLSFAVVGAFLFLYGAYLRFIERSLAALFAPAYMFGGAGVFLLCLALLVWAQRRTRPLYSARARRRFASVFEPRWRGVTASRDEATSGLARLPRIKLRLFDWTVVSGFFRAMVSVAFIALVVDHWVLGRGLQSSPLTDAPVVGVAARAHAQVFGVNGLIFAATNAPLSWAFNAELDDGLYTIIARSLLVVDTLLVVLAYLALLTVLLEATDWVVRFTAGRLAAGGLNALTNAMVLKKAYGNTTVGEHAYGVRTSPFEEGRAVADLPVPANEALVAYARANAADTLGRLHEALFRSDMPEEPTLEALADQLSWRELIHTAYFKVPESRASIVALASGATA